jgi:hypothetical protein
MQRVIPWLAVALLVGACDKETKPLTPKERNFPPEIREVSVQADRVLASQVVQVNCGAFDRDNDVLGYRWSASGGSFPFGRTSSIARWKTPSIRDTQTLSVIVTDLVDTSYADIEVSLTQVALPGSLGFINGTTLVDLSWEASIDEGVDEWSGYEVYGSTQSLAGLPPESLDPYRLTPSPIERRRFRVLGVEPGEKIYYQIRSRRDYEGIVEISPDGPEIDTAARLRGLAGVPLYEIGSIRGSSGIHMPDGSVRPLDADQVDEVDLYLGTESPTDEGGSLRLKSPSLLAYLDPAWAGRQTGIQQIEEGWGDPVAPEDGYVDQVPVGPGRIYAIRTPEGHYAKLHISQVPGAPPERRIWFQWAWQPAVDYRRY